jgi:hypothetical protein
LQIYAKPSAPGPRLRHTHEIEEADANAKPTLSEYCRITGAALFLFSPQAAGAIALTEAKPLIRKMILETVTADLTLE